MGMKRRNEKKHVIDFLFPLAVFFVLAASSVAIVVLASGFYSRQVKTSSASYSGRTALAYVTEKMHQNDENGAIADGTFDGENALVIRQRYDEKDYVTYLYAYDGYLRELFVRDGEGNVPQYLGATLRRVHGIVYILQLQHGCVSFSAVCLENLHLSK